MFMALSGSECLGTVYERCPDNINERIDALMDEGVKL
jgi:hypothetical protein